MVSIVEFIHPIHNNDLRDICIAALYYSQQYENTGPLTVEQLREKLSQARIKHYQKINIAGVLARSAPYVHSVGKEGNRFLWTLTSSGETYIRELLNIPHSNVEIENDVSTLEKIVQKIPEPEVKRYVEESIKCLKIGALRATVVFLWSGAVRRIQEKILSCDNTKLNAALQKHDPKSRVVNQIDDFAYIKEKILLLCAQDLGIFDKGQRDILEVSLDLRNNCGHPGKYDPGSKKVSSYIEDLIGIVFVY